MTDTMYDSAYPQNPAPATDVVLIYIGGDTPHVWTDAEIAAQPARFRLPCWVRSNPPGPGATADAEAAVAWLVGHGVPKGCAIVLDLETAIAPAYVSAFGNHLHSAGYLVLPYGSRSTLYQNPKLDGYFDAHPGDAEQVDPGNVATQWKYENTIDLDVVSKTVPLWDSRPPALPAPVAPAPQPAPAPPAPATPSSSGDDDMPLTDIVSFKPGQYDFFQVSPAGDLYHKWSNDGTAWNSEQLPSYIKFRVAKPVVRVTNEGCEVYVEDTVDGHVYRYFQSVSGSSWSPEKLP